MAIRLALIAALLPVTAFAADGDPLCATLETITAAAREMPPFASLASAPGLSISDGALCVREPMGNGTTIDGIIIGRRRHFLDRINETVWSCGLGEARIVGSVSDAQLPNLSGYLTRSAQIAAAGQALIPRLRTCLGQAWQENRWEPDSGRVIIRDPNFTGDIADVAGDLAQVDGTRHRVSWVAPDGVTVELQVNDFNGRVNVERFLATEGVVRIFRAR